MATPDQRIPIPLVVVQGFLGNPGVFSWDHQISKHDHNPLGKRRVLMARHVYLSPGSMWALLTVVVASNVLSSLGPVSSLHDRACELYYCLVGGTVDYGEEHSATHRHARYGRTFPIGLYPGWSRERPLHFIGHSIGGPTIIKLQHLLNEGHFGKDGDPDMILSVNAVCAPFRGTQLVYTLGESTTSAPSVRALSIGAALSKLIHVLAYFSPILPASLDVHADARLLSYKESSFASFVKHLWKSDWAESEDAAPYDMTFEAADAREAALEGRVYPNTFYRSHVSRMTRKLDADPGDHRHRPRFSVSFTHNLLYHFSKAIGLFDYSVLKPPPSFSSIGTPGYKDDAMSPTERLEVEGEEYWANDGIVPVFSQWHPLSCGATTCEHRTTMGPFHQLQREPQLNKSLQLPPLLGCWTVILADFTNHLSWLPGPFRETMYQSNFWKELGNWLSMVDEAKP